MALGDLLDRIDRRLREVGLSERRACLIGGLKPDSIRTIRRGHPPTLGKLRRLAEVLDVPLAYLVEAAADLRLDQSDRYPVHRLAGLSMTPPAVTAGAFAVEWRAGDMQPPRGYVMIPRADEGDDGAASLVVLPETLIRTRLGGEPHDFRMCRIRGSTMAPVLEHGDRVIVDIRRRTPTELGLFLIDEGMGPVARWVQPVSVSVPLRYRISAENPRIEAYEITVADAQVIGGIVWYSRCLAP